MRTFSTLGTDILWPSIQKKFHGLVYNGMKFPHTLAHHETIRILGPVSIREQPFCCFHESYPFGVNAFNVLQCIVQRTLTNKTSAGKRQERCVGNHSGNQNNQMWNYVELCGISSVVLTLSDSSRNSKSQSSQGLEFINGLMWNCVILCGIRRGISHF